MQFKNLSIAAIAMLLLGCEPLHPDMQRRPMAFHDTRLQYALVTGEDETLVREFDMRLPPSMTERIVAGGVLPFTAAMETVTWPFSMAIKTWAPDPEYRQSTQ